MLLYVNDSPGHFLQIGELHFPGIGSTLLCFDIGLQINNQTKVRTDIEDCNRIRMIEDEFKTKRDWSSAKDAPMTFMSIEEAALQSGISPQAISRYAMRGHFGECRKIGGKVRIPGKHFQEWMKKRQEGEMAHGFN